MTGDVTGPSSAIDSDIAVFDGTTGKIIKDSGIYAQGNETDRTVYIGIDCGVNASTGIDLRNVGVGTYALESLTGDGGIRNTAVGDAALSGTGTFDNCVGIGYNSGGNITSGTGNTAVGSESLFNVTDGTNNTALGRLALYPANGSENVGVGYLTGDHGSVAVNNCTFVGALSDTDDSTSTNRTALGHGAVVTADNAVQIGDTNVTSCAFGNYYTLSAATLSGVNTGDQTITLTGDITGSGTGSFAASYNNNVPALKGGFTAVNAGGTANAITATYSPALTLTNLTLCVVVPGADNSNTTPTFAPNSLTAHTITKRGGAPLVVGDIKNLSPAILEYNSANTRWELLNPATLDNTHVIGLGTLATQNGTFSGTSSGTNTGDQTITLTGDVTGTGTGSFTASYANNLPALKGGFMAVTAGGTANAITATYTPALTLTNLTLCVVVPGADNSSTTPTFAPDGLTAHTITKRGGAVLVAGDIKNLSPAILEYNSANTRWELLNPCTLDNTHVIGLGTLATQNGTFSGTSSGTNTGDQTDATLTFSDITTNNVSSTKHGFAPKSPADATKFLNGAATPAYAQVKDSDLSLSDVTTNNASTSNHGFLKKLDNTATHYMDGTGAWSTPAGTLPAATTFQYLTSGSSATYTTPANCRAIHLEMVGGGGGGGAITTNSGGAGGDTIFNSIHAAGGSGGGHGNTSGFGGAGGSGGTGSANLRLTGSGGDSPSQGAGSSNNAGGSGGCSPFGGAGSGGLLTTAATAGATNTGSGGGGGGSGTGNNSGGGGGSGEYVIIDIASPSATYTYTIGAGGAGGAAGTTAGAGGGTGFIRVTEYY